MTRWVHGISKDLLRAAFCEYFGVSQEHIEILMVLYARPGEWTTMKRLQVLLDSHRPPKAQAVYERISVLRDAMEPESLMSGGQLDNKGYALSEAGYAECAQALRAMVNVLLRAGPQISIPPAADADDPISHLGAADLDHAIRALEEARPQAPEATSRSLRTSSKAA